MNDTETGEDRVYDAPNADVGEVGGYAPIGVVVGRARDRYAMVSTVFASVLLGAIIWVILKQSLDFRGFPSLRAVAGQMLGAVHDSDFYGSLAVTIRRTMIAWVIAFCAGCVWGYLIGRWMVVDGVSRPWMLIGLALPSPMAVLFTVLLFGLSEVTALVGLIAVSIPFVANIVAENTAALPRHLQEMARAYRFGKRAQFTHVVLPFLSPAMLAAGRIALQLSWKEVVVMEALVRSDGIGQRFKYFYGVVDPQKIVAWTLLFTILLVFAELVVFRGIGRFVLRWRDE